MKEYKEKTIYCPKCGRKVGVYDGRSKNCNKRIVYHVDTGETEIKNIPKRNCSSGITFI